MDIVKKKWRDAQKGAMAGGNFVKQARGNISKMVKPGNVRRAMNKLAPRVTPPIVKDAAKAMKKLSPAVKGLKAIPGEMRKGYGRMLKPMPNPNAVKMQEALRKRKLKQKAQDWANKQ